MNASEIALFGGVYSNHLALAALLEDVRRRGIRDLYCLGDLGGFGPHPDKVFPLLRAAGVKVIQGNYDDSVGNDLPDCQCGYTDPRDNYFARLSYLYSHSHTSAGNKAWMRSLAKERKFELGGKRVHLCHGSPRKINEFLWESTTSTGFLERLCDENAADIIVATHTGLPWHRELPSGRHFLNCGAIGRPANDGRACVWYAAIAVAERRLSVQLISLDYDHQRIAAEMRDEGLPQEFITTIETGWWTTCLEVLPAKERARGVY
jgi:predicted phosphodiesterase